MVEIDDDREGEEPDIPVLQKVGIVMVALGEEVSGEVMKHLSDYEIEEITQAIASLKNISTELIDQVLDEFEQHLMAGEWIAQGGMDFARAALERAVGPRRAQEILERVGSKVSLRVLHSQECRIGPDRPVYFQRAPSNHCPDSISAGFCPERRNPGATCGTPAGGCRLPPGNNGEYYAQRHQGDRRSPRTVLEGYSWRRSGRRRAEGGSRTY